MYQLLVHLSDIADKTARQNLYAGCMLMKREKQCLSISFCTFYLLWEGMEKGQAENSMVDEVEVLQPTDYERGESCNPVMN